MTEAEWQIVRAVLPVPAWLEGRGGRPEGFCHDRRVRYVADNGVKWASLPADFPPYRRVHAFARRWQVTGLLAELHDRLRDKVRRMEGRAPDPTAAIVDSQSVRAAANIPRSTSGWDGGKKVGGRKRHLVVDCLGLVLAVAVTAASMQDRDAAVPLLERLRRQYFSVRLVWADGGYAGSLVGWAGDKLRLTLEIVKRTDDTAGFVVLPRRWVVERTLSWLMRSRRLARDYETLPTMHEAMVLWSMTMLMSGRLAGRRRGAFSRPEPRPGVNTPGRTWSTHPRSTRRFAFDRSPSTFAGTASSPRAAASC
ncbi:IS5 family transposase [Streptomyces sp. NPDC013172]|uniref:IS5 family transposase n=1 Tax=Streptomyces sp. NPDC013172 TaxID=3155009 RepID=UPI00340E7D0E